MEVFMNARLRNAILLGIISLGSFAFAQSLPLTPSAHALASNAMGDDLRPNQIGVFILKTNQTHVTWSGPDGDGDGVRLDPFVSTFDHTSGEVLKNKQVGKNPQYDTHNYPKMGATPDGRIFVTYGAHNDNIRVAMETQPGTRIFEEITVVTPDGSYPNPVLSKLTGRIYLFYRRSDDFGSGGTDPHRPLAMVYSDDNGKTWTAPVDVIDRAAPGGADDPDSDPDDLDEIYLGNVTVNTDFENGVEQIWLCWTLAGGPTHDDYHGNIYTAYLNPLDNNFYDAKGQSLGAKIQGVKEMDNAGFHIFAYASPRPVTTKNTSYVNHVSVGQDGYPLVNNTLKFDGSNWVTLATTGLGGSNVRGAWMQKDEDGILWHYRAMDLLRVYRSKNGGTWEQVLLSNAPLSGYGQGIPVEVPCNIQAFLYSKQGTKDVETNQVYLSGSNVELSANQLYIEADLTKAKFGDTVDVYVYPIGNRYGFITKDFSFGSEVSMSATGGSFVTSKSVVTDGVAKFKYVIQKNGRTRIKATAQGLAPAYFWITATTVGDETVKILEQQDLKGTTPRHLGIRYNLLGKIVSL